MSCLFTWHMCSPQVHWRHTSSWFKFHFWGTLSACICLILISFLVRLCKKEGLNWDFFILSHFPLRKLSSSFFFFFRFKLPLFLCSFTLMKLYYDSSWIYIQSLMAMQIFMAEPSMLCLCFLPCVHILFFLEFNYPCLFIHLLFVESLSLFFSSSLKFCVIFWGWANPWALHFFLKTFLLEGSVLFCLDWLIRSCIIVIMGLYYHLENDVLNPNFWIL